MNVSRPPRLATWLLNRFVSGHKGESLLGDLIEQYQHRLSRSWYWRQVVIAVLAAVTHEVRDHKLLAVRALSACWALLWFLGLFAEQFYRSMGLFIWNWTVALRLDMLRAWWFTYQLPLFVLLCVNATATGWIVARFSRRHQSAMVVLCALSLWVFWMAAGFGFVWHWGFFQRGRFTEPIQLVINMVVNFIAMPIAILVGGLWGARPDDQAPREIAIQ
jgi:hypothetical protein